MSGAALALLCLAACVTVTVSDDVIAGRAADEIWVGAWASSQQIPEPNNALDPADFTDATLRQTVRVSRDGNELRVRLANTFGAAPLHFTSVHIARAEAAGSARIVAGTDVALTFDGQGDVIVPPAAEYLSDPIAFPVAAFEDVTITFHVEAAPAPQTSHPGSRTTSYFVHGDQTGAEDMPGAKTVDHWFNIAAIDVRARSGARAIAIIGDSITDGRGSTTNQNNRWPDMLMRRLQSDAARRQVSVLNHGLGGNRILNYGNGPPALARFERDVIAQTGVRYAIVLEGVNDLGTFVRDGGGDAAAYAALQRRMIGAYRQMIARAHAHGIKIYGATIMPFAGFELYPSNPEIEGVRNAINDWMRNSGEFDAVLDFDAVTRDPDHPARLRAEMDTGDHIHVNPIGFQAMADSIPLSLFAP